MFKYATTEFLIPKPRPANTLDKMTKIVSKVLNYVLRLTYFRLHLAYIITISLVCSLIIWGIERNSTSVNAEYVDCLFHAVTAATQTGLITLDTSVLSGGSQAVLFIEFIICGLVMMSQFSVWVRRRALAKGLANWDTSLVPVPKDLKLELRALNLLIVYVPCYWIIINSIGIISNAISWNISPWNEPFIQQGIPIAWASFFMPISGFTNTGLSLFGSSMIPFDTNQYTLIWFSLAMMAGNTAYPILTRITMFTLHKFGGSRMKKTTRFLLDNPRRCFIYMFPAYETKILAGTLIIINVAQWVCWMALDWNRPIVAGLTTGSKIANFIFSTATTRTCGFNSLPIGIAHFGMQVILLFCMYIASYPMVAAIIGSQNTVTKNKGAKESEGEQEEDLQVYKPYPTKPTTKNLLGPFQFILARDVTILFCGIIAICIAEGHHMDNNDPDYSVFKIFFEAFSAFGTVGLSLGANGRNESFAVRFSEFSKVVIIVIMVLGRHRGLPLDVDTTVRLPPVKQREIEMRKTLELKRERRTDRSVTSDTTLEMMELGKKEAKPTGVASDHVTA